MTKRKYRVLVGIDYPPERRAEPDDVVDDIPEASTSWLLEQGAIEPAPRTTRKGGGA